MTVDNRVVLHVDGSNFVVIRKRRANRRNLIALAHKPMGRQAVPVVDGVVDLSQAVVTITKLRLRARVVVYFWGAAP